MNITTDTLKWKCYIRNKFRTIYWFLLRPKLYPQLLRLIAKKLFIFKNKKKNQREMAYVWCKKNAISVNEALRILTDKDHIVNIKHLYKEIFEEARHKEIACPVIMGGPGSVDILYWASESIKAESVIETGVAYGWSSLAILLSLNNRDKEGRLVSTDMPYPNINNDNYVGYVVPDQLKRNWTIIRYADREALPKAFKLLPEIDLCHYDSDKSYEGRMWAYPLLWQKLKVGGIFISDDIDDNFAFKDFVQSINKNFIVTESGKKFVGIVIK